MTQIKFCMVFIGVMWVTSAAAGESPGFGLSSKYCLGDVCLGETDANHPELKISDALKKVAKYKKIPICRMADASVNLREVKFKNGTEGSINLNADPRNLNSKPEKYFRISSITVKFSPALSAEGVKQLEQKIVGRYKMVRATAYSYEVYDGKRTISLTVAPWESRLTVTGFENVEFLAQPGCAPIMPNL